MSRRKPKVGSKEHFGALSVEDKEKIRATLRRMTIEQITTALPALSDGTLRLLHDWVKARAA